MSPLPEFIRREVERAIAEGESPAGMSLNDGKTRIGADKLRYLLAWIDRAAQAPAAEPLTDDARDAARYRWLRIGDNDEIVMRTYDAKATPRTRAFDPTVDNSWLPREEELDAAIDAALAAAKEQQP